MRSTAAMLSVIVLCASCTDSGTEPAVPGPSGTAATVSGIYPASAAAGDTVLIEGTGFGATRGTSAVTFGSVAASIYAQWNNTRILTAVPTGGTSAGVTITVDGVPSAPTTFTVKSTADPRVSFSGQVKPLLQSNGCTGCHGGTNNLQVGSYANLMSGTSNHGPVVVPYKGDQSVIILKLRGTASFGARMPQGGPFLSDANTALISRWIDQGARDN